MHEDTDGAQSHLSRVLRPWRRRILLGACAIRDELPSQTARCMQARNGSLFPAAIFTLYCTYLCYSAMVSEPHDYECNTLGHKLNAASASTLALGMGLALLSVVYSALRAGSNTALFNLGVSLGLADEAGEVEPLLKGEDREETAENGTSAGLDGAPETSHPPMNRGEPTSCLFLTVCMSLVMPALVCCPLASIAGMLHQSCMPAIIGHAAKGSGDMSALADKAA